MSLKRQALAPRKVTAALMVALLLTACASTKVNTRLALEPAKSASLRFVGADVASDVATLPTDVAERLKTAVNARLANLPQGTSPAKVRMTIIQYNVVAASDRFLTGVMAGASVMNVRVQIVDEQGNAMGDFDVLRSANAGAYGAFMDEKSSLIESTADGIAQSLGAPKK